MGDICGVCSQYEKALTCVTDAEALNTASFSAAAGAPSAPTPSLSSSATASAAVSSLPTHSSSGGDLAPLHSPSTTPSLPPPTGAGMYISRETFTFARFSIRCRSGDVEGAAAALRQLVAETASFEMALNALVMFLQGAGVVCVEEGSSGAGGGGSAALAYLDLFHLLGRKFNRYSFPCDVLCCVSMESCEVGSELSVPHRCYAVRGLEQGP